jgi:hypothetical protein
MVYTLHTSDKTATRSRNDGRLMSETIRSKRAKPLILAALAAIFLSGAPYADASPKKKASLPHLGYDLVANNKAHAMRHLDKNATISKMYYGEEIPAELDDLLLKLNGCKMKSFGKEYSKNRSIRFTCGGSSDVIVETQGPQNAFTLLHMYDDAPAMSGPPPKIEKQ